RHPVLGQLQKELIRCEIVWAHIFRKINKENSKGKQRNQKEKEEKGKGTLCLAKLSTGCPLNKRENMRNVVFAPGNFYHVYNRGVDRRQIFLEDNDRWRFLQGLCLFNNEEITGNILWQLERNRGDVTLGVLKEFISTSPENRNPLVRILAYCLMPNHYHFLVEEIRKDGISKFMQRFGGGYTRYFNNRYDRSGSLFQGTFKACLVDNEAYLQYLVVYLHVMNPGQLMYPNIKQEGVKDTEELISFVDSFPWSTHQEYMEKRHSIIIDKGILGESIWDSSTYRNLIKAVLDEKRYEEISHLMIEDEKIG
ncbi:MAG: hypothetical protein A3C04_03560, partial [Candidatus Wildermuthbacteria bacterium RIFCSPHIGHO2_02_FULL_45_25]